MSANATVNAGQSREVLHSLLHCVSQPLTTLHCVLESLLAQKEKQSLDDVSLALEQTDRIIEAVRLMKECLDAEENCAAMAKASEEYNPNFSEVLHETLDGSARCAAAGSGVGLRDIGAR